ncbi:MAG TPA: hypothetical protein VFE24_01335, partial [Pirellulales bacterium]|nr:hypothetical protein [Pirellulales bacterium]
MGVVAVIVLVAAAGSSAQAAGQGWTNTTIKEFNTFAIDLGKTSVVAYQQLGFAKYVTALSAAYSAAAKNYAVNHYSFLSYYDGFVG